MPASGVETTSLQGGWSSDHALTTNDDCKTAMSLHLLSYHKLTEDDHVYNFHASDEIFTLECINNVYSGIQ
jgi:hypothetical protein